MRAHLLFWVLGSALLGAALASFGYDPEADAEALAGCVRWLGTLAGFMAAWAVVALLLSPVILLICEGRCDWRKVRTGAGGFAAGSALAVALAVAVGGTYRLAVAVFGGWPAGWRAAAVGVLIGGVLGLLGGLGDAAWPRVAEWLGVRHQGAEPDPAPDRGR